MQRDLVLVHDRMAVVEVDGSVLIRSKMLSFGLSTHFKEVAQVIALVLKD